MVSYTKRRGTVFDRLLCMFGHKRESKNIDIVSQAEKIVDEYIAYRKLGTSSHKKSAYKKVIFFLDICIAASFVALVMSIVR